ncbi:MAG: hypothetical protein H7Y11_10195 [Armatimonadetes bacterium]|nr:hypothetical protein [Anaerolineae bacterium]
MPRNYDQYDNLFDQNDREARRKGKAKPGYKPKKSQAALLAEVADSENVLESGGDITYQPSRFESGWLMESLQPFFIQEQIVDVLAMVKGGKEANVYCCLPHPNTGTALLAAKVYRPHIHRQFRNDAAYKEGREVLTADGNAAKNTDQRLMRALNKKSGYGRQVAHTSWLMHEFGTLQTLYQRGASVPIPVASAENALLMGYIGDETMPAPPLSSVRLEPAEAEALFNVVLRNIHLMLQANLIHGDLSAYNILYWEGRVTLIDFPQVMNPGGSRQARTILERDITRVCDYFRAQGVERDPLRLTREMWKRYAEEDSELRAADESRFELGEEDTKYYED